MTAAEFALFRSLLSETATAFGRRLGPEAAEIYFRAVDDQPWDRVRDMLHRFARMADGETRWPNPGALRRLVLGQHGRGTGRALTDDEFSTVRQHLWEAMARWERTGGGGSARPMFEAAWSAAVCRLGDVQPMARERLWQAWLEAGVLLTRARARELLVDAKTRIRPGTPPFALEPLIAVVAALPNREPGSDDDDATPSAPWWDR